MSVEAEGHWGFFPTDCHLGKEENMPNKLATLFYLPPCLHGLYRMFYFESLRYSRKRDFDESTIDQIDRPPCFTTPPHVYTIFMGELLLTCSILRVIHFCIKRDFEVKKISTFDNCSSRWQRPWPDFNKCVVLNSFAWLNGHTACIPMNCLSRVRQNIVTFYREHKNSVLGLTLCSIQLLKLRTFLCLTLHLPKVTEFVWKTEERQFAATNFNF